MKLADGIILRWQTLEAIVVEVTRIGSSLLDDTFVRAIDGQGPGTTEAEQSRADIEQLILEYSEHLVLLGEEVLEQHRLKVQIKVAIFGQPVHDVTEVVCASLLDLGHVLEQAFDVQRRLLLQSQMQGRIVVCLSFRRPDDQVLDVVCDQTHVQV